MKKRKRILALLLSSAMALTMGLTAFAASDAGVGQSAGTGTGSSENSGSAGSSSLEDSSSAGSSESGTTQQNCTITAPNNGHTYEIYQIFTGRYEVQSDGTEKMSDVKWGINGTGETGTAVDEDVLKKLQDVNDKSDDEKRTEITKYVTLSNPVATLSKDNLSYTEGLAGYYLIKDKAETVTGNMKETPYIVQAVGSLTITPKTGDTPTFEKKIKDINDSESTTYTDWQDSADYDIGDQIPFKLEGTVAGDYAAYEHYYFAFHDQEDTGLTFDSSTVEVYVYNTDEDSDTRIFFGYRVVTDAESMTDPVGKSKCSFEIIFDDLKSIAAVEAGSKIRVEYKSTLNEKAVLGAEGNVNKGKLEYSNNPSDTQNGKGKTPWDSVIAFTYKVVVNKYANEVDAAGNNKLSGAEFTLEKKDLTVDGQWKTLALVKSDDGKSFSFSGLDDGEYRLTETTAPQYYNKLTSPIIFKVEAGHTEVWNGENRTQVLTSLTGTETNADGTAKDTGKIEFTFTANDDKSDLTTNVINKSGTTLPETGGIGTTIFYIVGGVLVVGAAVALITKKRMKSSGKDR